MLRFIRLGKKPQAELVSYVREMWDSKTDEDSPEDDAELVGHYFDHVPEEYLIAEAAQPTLP
ncbi:MAG TPA: hypothetical protein VG860_04395 [Terriglobia bacterium]|nr:hypothetical protein [Terriglobia bacterium]